MSQKKTVQNCFCQNFVKFPPVLIIFGIKMTKRLKLCEVYYGAHKVCCTQWMKDNNLGRKFNKLIILRTTSDCQTPSGQIPGDRPEQEIDGYGGKNFEKRKVLRQQSHITATTKFTASTKSHVVTMLLSTLSCRRRSCSGVEATVVPFSCG